MGAQRSGKKPKDGTVERLELELTSSDAKGAALSLPWAMPIWSFSLACAQPAHRPSLAKEHQAAYS